MLRASPFQCPFTFNTMASTLAFIAMTAHAQTGRLEVAVNDVNGAPMKEAVVSATRLDSGRALESGGEEASPPGAVIAQENRQFVPLVTAVEVGTAISFPNHDDILHNVYSFSEAKKFELPLYKNEPPEPVVFDRPGVVILGCNIHDWMVAYVYVLETPYFSKTNSSGRVTLTDLPAGRYQIEVRHPRKRRGGSTPVQRVTIYEDAVVQSEFTIILKPRWRPERSTAAF